MNLKMTSSIAPPFSSLFTALVAALLSAVCVVTLILPRSAAASGSKAGNGGHGVVCSGYLNAELLDLYEAREVYGIIPTYVPWATVESELSRLNFELSLVLGSDHAFLQRFREAAALQESIVLHDGPLGYTQDAGFLAAPLSSDCTLVQIAHRTSFAGVLSNITVQSSVWNSMSATQQALLLLHEASHSWFNIAQNPAQDIADLPSTLAARQIIGILTADNDYRHRKANVIRQIIDLRQPAATAELR